MLYSIKICVKSVIYSSSGNTSNIAGFKKHRIIGMDGISNSNGALMERVKTICIFCGANVGKDGTVVELTYNIGQIIAKNGISIVCGGSSRGLMGAIIDGVLSAGGKAVGVLPAVLEGVEVPHAGLEDLLRTPCVATRKQQMREMSDAFLILPGGYGTLDEIFEMVALKRMNVHQKPMILFNYHGFYDLLLKQIEKMALEGFIRKDAAHVFIIVTNIDELKSVIEQY